MCGRACVCVHAMPMPMLHTAPVTRYGTMGAPYQLQIAEICLGGPFWGAYLGGSGRGGAWT